VTYYLAWRERQTAPLTVTEVPLLYETGGDARFDRVVVVTAPRQLREARREPLPGDREARLIDDREKVRRADYAYENTGSLEQLDEFVLSVVQDLTR
jgi:dephospho-CoA kinase